MEIRENYLQALMEFDRDQCIQILKSGLDEKRISLDDALDLVASALSLTVNCSIEEIWKEHAKTQIVRSSLEILSLYTLKEVPETNNKQIAVVCPNGEYHELGARLVSEVIRREGYKPLFFGNSMPNAEIINLIKEADLEGIAFSISNFYSMRSFNILLKEINEITDIPIFIGGTAINHNPDQLHAKNLYIVKTLDELKESLKVIK